MLDKNVYTRLRGPNIFAANKTDTIVLHATGGINSPARCHPDAPMRALYHTTTALPPTRLQSPHADNTKPSRVTDRGQLACQCVP